MSFIISNTPRIDTFWRGLGGHFDSLPQLLNEFIDNSISNFIGNHTLHSNIQITLKENNGDIEITIEDTGTGIKDIDKAFTLGEQSCSETSMNEHGFGMKHALATADPSNTNWYILTRTSEMMQDNKYAKISATYLIDNYSGEIIDDIIHPWPGTYNNTGTIIHFKCNRDFFNTIRTGLRGGVFGFEKLVTILIEDIGFTYSTLIKNANVSITVVHEDRNGVRNHKRVGSVEPNWEEYFAPGRNSESLTVDGENLIINYEFGSMNESDYEKYYKRNMSSSGVEIRINGRLIAYNLFKEIWGIEKHNSYNYLLIRIDLISQNKKVLPITRTSKNGIRQGDPVLEQIYSWIRTKVTTPQKNQNDIDDEVDLFLQLRDMKRSQIPDPKVVATEKKVFSSINARISIDLYVSYGSDVIIYEGKKDITTVKDVYQLKMYWDGLTIDGIIPIKGILISTVHPQPVLDLVTYVNMMKDINGNNYNFSCKKWRDESIQYPVYQP